MIDHCAPASGERFQPSSAAITVRQANDKTDVLDGPYADTKEQFAGYFLVTVPDLDEAIAWAKRCPSSKYGLIRNPAGLRGPRQLEVSDADEAGRRARGPRELWPPRRLPCGPDARRGGGGGCTQ